MNSSIKTQQLGFSTAKTSHKILSEEFCFDAYAGSSSYAFDIWGKYDCHFAGFIGTYFLVSY